MIECLIEQYGESQGLTIQGDEIIEWPYAQPKPTKEEHMALHQAWLDANAYKEKRKAEMPSQEEMLEAIYEMVANDDSTKILQMKAKIDGIKAKHPKP
jgi:hypothetical protein